jgi:hypothetical protein
MFAGLLGCAGSQADVVRTAVDDSEGNAARWRGQLNVIGEKLRAFADTYTVICTGDAVNIPGVRDSCRTFQIAYSTARLAYMIAQRVVDRYTEVGFISREVEGTVARVIRGINELDVLLAEITRLAATPTAEASGASPANGIGVSP